MPLGADGAPRGWLVAAAYAAAPSRADTATAWTELYLVDDIAALAELHARKGEDAAVAIDIPIGLPGPDLYRRCDEQARERLGPLRSSVFMPPARYMLGAAGDYPRIRELVEQERAQNPEAKGLSAQAAGITRKVAEVDGWVCADRVAHFSEIGGGYGGYNQDHEFFGYRQSI